MADSRQRSMWAGLAALVVGVLLFLVFLTMSGGGPSEAEVPDQPEVADRPDPDATAPPMLGEREGPSHKPPGVGEEETQDRGEPEDQAEEANVDGPVGDVLAIDLETVAVDPPGGRPSLVSPRWSPDGKHLMAISGRTAVPTVWILPVDEPDRGWTSMEGVTDPDWIDNNTLALVKDELLYSYRIDGKLFGLVGEADEPGVPTRPAASPDGSKVAYISTTTTNRGDIRVLDRPTKVVRNVTATAARVDQPAWRPDGKAVAGIVDGVVHGWELDSRDPVHRFPRAFPARNPGYWGNDALHWQEGASFAVNLVYAAPPAAPEIIARRALASVERPAPVAGGFVWVASLTSRGTLWAVRPDGSGVEISTDAALASQPDVVERGGKLWVAFTSAETGTATARVHVGTIDPSVMRME